MPKKKNKYLFFLIICFVLVFLIYSQSLFAGFVFDDRKVVQHQETFSNINSLPSAFFVAYSASEYRPMLWVSCIFNYSFFGAEPWSFHFLNLVLYALVVYFLFLFIYRLFKDKHLAYLASLLFLFLPIHTEAVANIFNRSEILSLLFSLLALLEVIKKKQRPWLAAFWFFLAILSKETAIAVLPIVLWIILWKKTAKIFRAKSVAGKSQKIGKLLIRYKKKLLDSFSALITMIGLLALYFTARFFVLGVDLFSNTATIVENPLKFVSFKERFLTALGMLTIYIKKSFWPFELCSDYSYNQVPVTSGFNAEALFGLGVILFFIISIPLFFRKAPVISLASVVFLAAYLPISNLIFPIGTIGGERLMFFPSMGLCLILAYLLLKLARIKPVKYFGFLFLVLTISIFLLYGIMTFTRALDWQSEKTLFNSAAQCAPNSVLSVSNLGSSYYLAGDYTKAEEVFLRADKIYDKYSKGVNNLGLTYWKQGKFQKAREQYFKALKNWPPYEGVYENLALLYLSQGEIEKAERWLRFGLGDRVADAYMRGLRQ